MRLAVISDIHANREALDAVMVSIEEKSPDRIICLGDLVNYGVDFEYCIDLVKKNADVCLMGNHDSTVINRDPLRWMNREAQRSAQWTMAGLSDDRRQYLESLPIRHSSGEIMFVHSTPGAPERWHYVTNWFDAATQFDNFQQRLCVVGHSHTPGVYSSKREGNLYREGILSAEPDSKYIVNVGSVGQPRDRNPRACYVVIDEEAETIEFVRISYDVETASEKIASTGVSAFNARRILAGI